MDMISSLLWKTTPGKSLSVIQVDLMSALSQLLGSDQKDTGRLIDGKCTFRHVLEGAGIT